MRLRLFLLCSIISGVLSGTGADSSSAAELPAEVKTFVDTISPADREETVRLLKQHFVDADKVKDLSTDGGALAEFLRKNPDAIALSASQSTPAKAQPMASDILNAQTAYIRFGALRSDRLGELDKAIGGFAGKKVSGLIVDLRASHNDADFDVAAEYARRFTPRGENLWTLRGRDQQDNRTYANEREPAFQGVTMVLIDHDTCGAAEPIAAALKANAKALLIGERTAGGAVGLREFPLPSGKSIKIAAAEAVAGGRSLFPNGLDPDLAVTLSPETKQKIFALSAQQGMSPFLSEPARPHFNEAALISGSNPELEQRPSPRSSPREDLQDLVLQRAVDVITSLAILETR